MKTLLVCCGAVAREVLALREKYDWKADVLALPAQLHNRPEKIPPAVRDKVKQRGKDYDRVLVIYGDCGTRGKLDLQLDELQAERIAGPHCYEQFAGSRQFAAMMEDEPGTFFLTDYLAQSFDHLVIEGLGLVEHPELHKDYFGNYHRMIYLQQRDDPRLLERAQAAADSLDLPLEIQKTGYGEFETRLLAAMAAE